MQLNVLLKEWFLIIFLKRKCLNIKSTKTETGTAIHVWDAAAFLPLILAALIALGLWRAEGAMVRGFSMFGKAVAAVATLGLALAIVEGLTGFAILPGMVPISEGFLDRKSVV